MIIITISLKASDLINDDAFDTATGHYYPKYYGKYIRHHYPSYYTHGDYTAFGPDLAPNIYWGADSTDLIPVPRENRRSMKTHYGFDKYYYKT